MPRWADETGPAPEPVTTRKIAWLITGRSREDFATALAEDGEPPADRAQGEAQHDDERRQW
ncbi:hypothetical protein GCM10010244_34830 [Streptomyces coeruleorubidus]|nr:hypothetical protein GCM10010244_34830 [Streptomyces bellus]